MVNARGHRVRRRGRQTRDLLQLQSLDPLQVQRLALRRRQRLHALPHGGRVLPRQQRLVGGRAVVGDVECGVVQRLLVAARPASQHVQRLVARDPDDPRADRRMARKIRRPSPDLDESLAHHVVRGSEVVEHPSGKGVHGLRMARVQGAQGRLIRARHARQQIAVCVGLVH